MTRPASPDPSAAGPGANDGAAAAAPDGRPPSGAGWRLAALLAGPVLALACGILLPDHWTGAGGAPLSPAARASLAMLVWMLVWWVTEAVPLEATSLLPVVTFPLLGIASVRDTLAPYASDVIFLFLGGFVLAAGMSRWGLDRRFALAVLRRVGSRPDAVLGGVMVTTAFVSLWVSNTAAAAMMLPIALSLIRLAGDGPEARRFGAALLLSVAYAASIGGLGTLIGSPPNGIVARFASGNLGREISFARWLLVGMPLVLVLLPVVWLLLTRVVFRYRGVELGDATALLSRASRESGPMSPGARATLLAFAGAGLLWLTRPLLAGWTVSGVRPLAGLTDAGIAVAAALALFVWPVQRDARAFAMDWKTASQLPWGVLLLFGGGLSLAAALEAHGVAAAIAAAAQPVAALPDWAATGAIVAASVFLSEVMSNTAQVAASAPLLAGMAPALGMDPVGLLAAGALAASCAFMMPMGTPPNAIVFGTGHLTIAQMCRAGLLLNLASIVVITVYAMAWLPLVLPR